MKTIALHPSQTSWAGMTQNITGKPKKSWHHSPRHIKWDTPTQKVVKTVSDYVKPVASATNPPRPVKRQLTPDEIRLIRAGEIIRQKKLALELASEEKLAELKEFFK